MFSIPNECWTWHAASVDKRRQELASKDDKNFIPRLLHGSLNCSERTDWFTALSFSYFIPLA